MSESIKGYQTKRQIELHLQANPFTAKYCFKVEGITSYKDNWENTVMSDTIKEENICSL